MQIRGTWSAGPGDDQARFLADLRALRDSAAIGHDELAARAHYPSDVLKEAENGPTLPGLPILTAYVRACDGDVLDWEERWRRLNPEAPDDPDLPVRLAGASPAAQAGARAGVGVAPPDVYDPERIKAALRGGRARTEHGDRRASDPGVLAPAPALSVEPGSGGDGWGAASASAGWDPAPDPGVTAANGNHSATVGNRGPFDAAFTSLPEAAEPAAAEPAPAEEFSWLQRSEPEPESGPAGGDGDLGWPGQTANGGSAEPADRSYGWSGHTETARPGHEDPDVTERFLRHQAEGLATGEQTDFWGQP
ncbi:MAG TPA: helix-turn-helix transcriptional regulator, partial [Streptosporangiaceae bacterium]